MGGRISLIAWLVFLLPNASVYPQTPEYQVKDLQLRLPQEYAAHQTFQKLTIGAYPCNHPEKVQEIFDTKRLLEKGFFPVLLIIKNDNDFSVRLAAEDIFLVDGNGDLHESVPYQEVLLELYLKKSASRYSVREEILIEEFVEPNALIDFEQKALEEELVAPGRQVYGVVFFPLPEDRNIAGFRLYFSRIVNVETKEPLIFFEFELLRSQP